jgi:hypothetical protein
MAGATAKAPRSWTAVPPRDHVQSGIEAPTVVCQTNSFEMAASLPLVELEASGDAPM